jgi:hypothetical protein
MVIVDCTSEASPASKPISRVWYYECENDEEITSYEGLKDKDEHSYQQGSRTWNLTVNQRELQGRIGVRTATLDDLNDYGCVGGIYEDRVIHIDDGFFIWDGQVGEYEPVEDLKDVVLSRMESLGLENSRIYEEIVSKDYKNWRLHSLLDLNDYSLILG